MMPQWLPLLPHTAVTVPSSALEPDTKDALSLRQIPGSKGFNRITQIDRPNLWERPYSDKDLSIKNCLQLVSVERDS